MRRAFLVLGAAALLALAGGGSAGAASTPGATCTEQPSGATTDCEAWHRSDVRIAWDAPPPDATGTSGCDVFTLASDGTSAQSCTWTFAGGVSITVTKTLRRDTTPPTVSSQAPSRGPDEGGWYNHPLSVSFSGSDATSGIASCTNASYGGPDSSSASVSGSCSDAAGNTSAPQSYSFKYDASPPSVSAAAARAPDANGWYVRPVAIAFSGSDSTSGIAGCTSATYGGPDAAGATVSGSCRDQAGNTGSASATINYDATPPQVTGVAAERPPDANGWYNHPVSFVFAGADATSGIDACTSVTYRGPDGASASVRGTCRDKAGNTGPELVVPLEYDATAPSLSAVEAIPGDRNVVLHWRASGGVATVLVERWPNRRGAKHTVVYKGRGGGYVDRKVRNGSRYRYRVVVLDVAGNAAIGSALVTPSAPLVSPLDGARVKAPVVLRWHAVGKATYYNVQLRLGRKKVLSLWPGSPRLRLPREWVFEGITHRLVPGKYRWDVWPGFGSRSAARYGRRLGTSHFVVVR